MEQQVEIKCPYCGAVRTIDIQAYADAGGTYVTRGPVDEIKKAAEGIRKLLSDGSLEAANAWLDMPKCPRCENTCRYNVKTHEVKR